MCFSEYFAVIPKGCRSKNKHTWMIKDVIPCFETVFLSMARNAGAGGDVTSLNIILCADKDCVKIDCFRDKLETKALQTKNPYCPVCVGEKTLAEAMTLQENENTQYAILLNGNLLRTPDDRNLLPKYVVQRQYFLEKAVKFEPKPISVKTDVGSKLRYTPRRSDRPPIDWDDPDADTTFNMYVWMFTALYDEEGCDEMEEVAEPGLPWFYDTWTDEE